MRLESDLGQAGREENTLEEFSHPLEELVHVGSLQDGDLRDRHTHSRKVYFCYLIAEVVIHSVGQKQVKGHQGEKRRAV